MYYAEKDQIFVATQLYEIIGFQIIKDKAPERFAVFRGHIAAINKLIRVGNILISGSQDGELFTWEIPRFEKQEQIVKPSGKSTEHDGFITALAVCGRTIASAASDHKIIIYNLKGTKLCKNMIINSAHASYISGLALTENSVISCSHDSTIKIFSLHANKNPYYNATVAVHTANLEHIQEYAQKMFNISSFTCSKLACYPFDAGLPNCISLGRDIAVGTTNGQVFLFDYELNLQQINDLHEDGVGEVITAVRHIDDLVVVGTNSGTVLVWGRNVTKNVVPKYPIVTLSE